MITKQTEFSIKPLGRSDDYYGFSLAENPLHVMPDGTIFHNSGKSVAEQSIVGHVSRYSDKFILVGVDVKRVEFNLLRGVKGVAGVALDVKSSADIVAAFQQCMMDRFKFMEKAQVNNVYKIHDKEVPYFELWGRKYQFDEMFELTVDLDKNDRNYSKNLMTYPDGRQPKIMTIQRIYEGLQKDEFGHPQLQEIKGHNSYVDKNTIRKTSGIFSPKAMLLLCDELNELMNSEDYKSVDTIKQGLGSIARLGRAAGVHLALACQRASNGTISTDLKNNIQLSLLLGAFDTGASTLMFEKDITNLQKPEIKGRGFLGSGNDIVEVQTYFSQPENDWVFDENQKQTYTNPVFLEQKKRRNETINDTGWVAQYRLDEEGAMNDAAVTELGSLSDETENEQIKPETEIMDINDFLGDPSLEPPELTEVVEKPYDIDESIFNDAFDDTFANDVSTVEEKPTVQTASEKHSEITLKLSGSKSDAIREKLENAEAVNATTGENKPRKTSIKLKIK